MAKPSPFSQAHRRSHGTTPADDLHDERYEGSFGTYREPPGPPPPRGTERHPEGPVTRPNERNPGGVSYQDPRYFSERIVRGPSEPAEQTRRDRQGSGGARDCFDERFFSDSCGPAMRGAIGRRVDLDDRDGFPTEASQLVSAASERADRIRASSRDVRGTPKDTFDKNICSERHTYSD
jgi:hypothetical protein